MPCEQRQKLIFGHPDRQALTESKKYLFLGAKVLRIDPFSGIRWLIMFWGLLSPKQWTKKQQSSKDLS